MKKTINTVLVGIVGLLPSSIIAAGGCGVNTDTTSDNYGKVTPCTSTSQSVGGLIVKITNWVLGFGASIAILFIIYGGFLYLTAAGNEKQAESAKQTLTYAVIGLIVILLAYVIVSLVGNVTGAILTTTTPTAATTPTTP